MPTAHSSSRRLAAARTCRKCPQPARIRGLCREHNAQLSIEWDSLTRQRSPYTDAHLARAHLRDLRAAALSTTDLHHLTGIPHTTLRALIPPRIDRRTATPETTRRTDEHRILGLPVPSRTHMSSNDVCAVGTRRRLQSLVAFGYMPSDLCRRIGQPLPHGYTLFLDTTDTVPAAVARQATWLFNHLQLIPGPSPIAADTGRRLQWPLPFDWDEDDLDDPDARPAAAAPKPKFPEQYTELRMLGYDDHDIAHQLGIAPTSLERKLYRYNMIGKAAS